MKYRLRKVIDRHYPKDDYSNFELLEEEMVEPDVARGVGRRRLPSGDHDCRKPLVSRALEVFIDRYEFLSFIFNDSNTC